MVNITVGDKVLIEFSTFGDRFLSVVTDVKSDGRLLVYSPVSKPILDRLRTDRKVLVRYAHEGQLRGFKSRVLNEVESANTLLELDKPTETYDAEERAEPRCVCCFPATVVEGQRAAQAVVEDMSANYSRVRFLNGGIIPFLEDEESEVRLTFHPFDISDGYSVECVVRNTFVKDGTRYAILEFKQEEKDARSRIAQFVEAQVCCGIPRL